MSGPDDLTTHFAPAGRETAGQVHNKAILIATTPLLQQTIDAVPDAVLILNPQRQIVAANAAVLQMFACDLAAILGKRPGELLGCRNASQGPDGCGTSPDCSVCGAVKAVLESQQTAERVIRECRIVLEEPMGALDLKVTAAALVVENQRFTICLVKDISDHKRLAVLARIFFHDVINTAGGIRGFTELLREHLPKDSPEEHEAAELEELADRLVEEIQAQRDLLYAESGDLQPRFASVNAHGLLLRLRALYASHPVAAGRQLILAEHWSGTLVTDERLLSRVLGNMIKNALEATPTGAVVTMRSRHEGTSVTFSVNNPVTMAPDVQKQIFQRSFSTKGTPGRGIGTHSMRLLGERYLGGKVGFTSRDPDGTTFFICLPEAPLE